MFQLFDTRTLRDGNMKIDFSFLHLSYRLQVINNTEVPLIKIEIFIPFSGIINWWIIYESQTKSMTQIVFGIFQLMYTLTKRTLVKIQLNF